MSARDVISSRDYAALSEAVRDALDRCAGGFDRYHADHAVDAVLDGLDHLGYAVVKLPSPEPSPDGESGVMFHGRGSAMVIFVDDDGRIWDSDGEWTRGESRANAAAFLAAARHAEAGERGE